MSGSHGSKHVAVIGAGIGGMSAAIMLARQGFDVTIIEKNDQLGGKLNQLQTQGFSFDLGPSIFTLPQMFRPIFEGDGKRLEDYIALRRVDPQWRNFFEDGTVLNLWENPERMRAELAPFGPRVIEEFEAFAAYSRRQYQVVERGYLARGLDTFLQFLRFYGWKDARDLDYFRSMSGSIYKRLSNPYLRDIFEYFIKYVGSSALDSPGFMNLMPNIQMEFGLWYVSGGLYQLAHAFRRRLEECGVTVRLGQEVLQIEHANSSVTGVELRGRRGDVDFLRADFVVSNMEVIPAMQKLLDSPASAMKKVSRFRPSCSGIVIHLGLNRVYPQLAHHNFFYSQDLHAHFRRVFRQGRLPDDPTLYVVAPTRTDPSQAPPGCDNIKILPHIPPLDESRLTTRDDYIALKTVCLDKLERMGLADLRRHIVVEDFWTPFDIEARYGSNRGSIYGVVCDRRSNFAFKAPKQSSRFRNLFFVGGSVNPGAGMPMVALSGQHVARMIAEQYAGETA
ncbi:phytoene desaturase family protein [Occallatibacter riparius]|uniref:Phytoene desaturase family protein n=1 Tax=Occallatibacter riparius TaxID=1002689 RepID=A0A9J7BGM7_9BACT|nr:phytoene desaturase family protein [Occallatibacter riparius]UWZ81681.1 phytoene desaturase family protein [Occallatibacter riparius]